MRTDPARRARIWRHAAAYPGGTPPASAGIHRAAMDDITEPAVRYLCYRMEADGQLTRVTAHDPDQGRPVNYWHPVPGAFP